MLSVRALRVLAFYEVCDFLVWFLLGSYIQSTTVKLEGELFKALANIKYYYNKASCALEAQLYTYTWLTRLKKVHKKLHSKKHYLWEQGVLELKAVEKKKKNSLEVESLTAQVACLSPLTNSFIFNPFFSMLPDVIFNNTPVLFF